MFGKLGKQYADAISERVEGLVNDHLEKKNPGGASKTEKATESIGQISGRRRALLIGINYVGQKGELRGCINDVRNIRSFLESTYRIDDICVLTDDSSDKSKLPTRANILSGFQWLRSGAKAGDSLILHYSGHGGSVKDEDGDEEDGKDETLVPLDYESAGQIVDDEVHAVLVRGLPAGVRLTAVMDCCHSGSALDLPYAYNVGGDLVITESDRTRGISKMVSAGVRCAMDGNKKLAMESLTQGMKMVLSSGKSGGGDSSARAKAIQTRATVADVVQFSGCRDSQTSADASIDGQATGAMSHALISALKESVGQGRDLTYTQLLRRMRQVLEGKYTQVPMMTAGRKLDLNASFGL